MLNHGTPKVYKSGMGSDEAVIRELERTGTPPEAITEQLLPATVPTRLRCISKELGQVVLVLQGGGALGAYQVGVYQALHEAGVEPDWVIGTSIGAINASLIAGNGPENRMGRLREFWCRMQHSPWAELLGAWPVIGPWAANLTTIAQGIPAFFRPNPLAKVRSSQRPLAVLA